MKTAHFPRFIDSVTRTGKPEQLFGPFSISFAIGNEKLPNFSWPDLARSSLLVSISHEYHCTYVVQVSTRSTRQIVASPSLLECCGDSDGDATACSFLVERTFIARSEHRGRVGSVTDCWKSWAALKSIPLLMLLVPLYCVYCIQAVSVSSGWRSQWLIFIPLSAFDITSSPFSNGTQFW